MDVILGALVRGAAAARSHVVDGEVGMRQRIRVDMRQRIRVDMRQRIRVDMRQRILGLL